MVVRAGNVGAAGAQQQWVGAGIRGVRRAPAGGRDTSHRGGKRENDDCDVQRAAGDQLAHPDDRYSLLIAGLGEALADHCGHENANVVRGEHRSNRPLNRPTLRLTGAWRARFPPHRACGSFTEASFTAGADGGGTTGPMSPSGDSSRSRITGA